MTRFELHGVCTSRELAEAELIAATLYRTHGLRYEVHTHPVDLWGAEHERLMSAYVLERSRPLEDVIVATDTGRLVLGAGTLAAFRALSTEFYKTPAEFSEEAIAAVLAQNDMKSDAVLAAEAEGRASAARAELEAKKRAEAERKASEDAAAAKSLKLRTKKAISASLRPVTELDIPSLAANPAIFEETGAQLATLLHRAGFLRARRLREQRRTEKMEGALYAQATALLAPYTGALSRSATAFFGGDWRVEGCSLVGDTVLECGDAVETEFYVPEPLEAEEEEAVEEVEEEEAEEEADEAEEEANEEAGEEEEEEAEEEEAEETIDLSTLPSDVERAIAAAMAQWRAVPRLARALRAHMAQNMH